MFQTAWLSGSILDIFCNLITTAINWCCLPKPLTGKRSAPFFIQPNAWYRILAVVIEESEEWK
jgi:hypothetical protein